MSFASDFLSDGISELIVFLGSQTITINGAEFPCIPNALERGSQLVVGGNIVDVAFKVFISSGEFLTADTTIITVDSDTITADNSTAIPRAGYASGSFKGKQYRIVNVRQSEGHIELFLADIHSNK